MNQTRPLTDAELDLVSGGWIGFPLPWNPVPPPKPVPGGPILITCIVGKGCMTRQV